MSVPTIKEAFSGTSWASLCSTCIFEKVCQVPGHAVRREKQRWRRHAWPSSSEKHRLSMNTAAAVTFKKQTNRHYLVLSRYKKNFKIKDKIPPSTMWTANCIDKTGEASVGSRRSFVLGLATVNFLATFRWDLQLGVLYLCGLKRRTF